MSFVVSWIASFLGARYAYLGVALFTAPDINPVQVPIIGLGCVALWIGARRFRRIEVEPLFLGRDFVRRGVPRDYEWLKRLVPHLTPSRSESVKVVVAQLAAKYFTLLRYTRSVDAATARQLETLLENAARLGSMLCEIEAVLRAPASVARLQRYADLDRQIATGVDSTRGVELRQERDTLRDEVHAHCALEEKCEALGNRLVAVHALFNRLLARLLVFQGRVDRETSDLLTDSVVLLERDLDISRQVQADLARGQ
jgi:hypothetical protein